MTIPTCDRCPSNDWPKATVIADGTRLCQECAENTPGVKWDDPWDNPQHEVNEVRHPIVARWRQESEN